jgi:hypothetical protein
VQFGRGLQQNAPSWHPKRYRKRPEAGAEAGADDAAAAVGGAAPAAAGGASPPGEPLSHAHAKLDAAREGAHGLA